jgi:pimeloyl-ACP methyl ester carboxylesterase
VPTLIIHGDDDEIVPYADAGLLSAKTAYVPRSKVRSTKSCWDLSRNNALVEPAENGAPGATG